MKFVYEGFAPGALLLDRPTLPNLVTMWEMQARIEGKTRLPGPPLMRVLERQPFSDYYRVRIEGPAE